MPTYRGQQGVAIHIGLNKVDPDCYGGWNGALKGCINDARSMEAITSGLDYSVTTLLDEDATAQAVLDAITGSADSLSSGDILVLTYSGHGGQVQDTSGDESDSQDETWVCYDRMVLDDELYQAFQEIPEGVRIFMLSDSCHSGTVARAVYTQLTAYEPLARQYVRAAAGYRDPAAVGDLRVIPNAVLVDQLRSRADLYRHVKATAKGARAEDVAASLILISGCQDNQLSADGTTNGLFTEKLLAVWDDGAFNGDYPTFHRRIVAQMPATQTPNYFRAGATDAAFEGQTPFTVEAPSGSGSDSGGSSSSGSPSVSGPATVGRDDAAPAFEVDTAGAGYYIFEITSDPQQFDASQGTRTSDTFYGSWDDPDAPARYTDSTYTLPDAAWEALKQNDRLYFRIGTTTSEDSWDDYAVSTGDDGADAPSLEITGTTDAGGSDSGSDSGASGSGSSSGSPSVSGPATVDRSESAPAFDVDTAGAGYYIFEITSEPDLFDYSSGTRTAENFYGSWEDPDAPARYTDSTYTLPDAAWEQLKQNDRLYFRIGTTTSEDSWDDYAVSTGDDDGANAPSLEITGDRAAAGTRAIDGYARR